MQVVWSKYVNNLLRRQSVINKTERRKILCGFEGETLDWGNSRKAVEREREFKGLKG